MKLVEAVQLIAVHDPSAGHILYGMAYSFMGYVGGLVAGKLWCRCDKNKEGCEYGKGTR